MKRRCGFKSKSMKRFEGKCEDDAKVVREEGMFSGCSSSFYGVYKEESDIRRNNGRLWEFLDFKTNGKLLLAIMALGVVDVEGRNNMECRLDLLENDRNIVKKVVRMDKKGLK